MDKIKAVEENINKICAFMGISPSVYVNDEDGNIMVDIQGDKLNFLIGYRGESLDALQNFLGMSANKEGSEWIRVLVDINEYRRKKVERIEDIARNFIDKVRFLNEEIELPPMNSFERYHVHTLVSGYTDIESESMGEGYNRRVVLKPKNIDV